MEEVVTHAQGVPNPTCLPSVTLGRYGFWCLMHPEGLTSPRLKPKAREELPISSLSYGKLLVIYRYRFLQHLVRRSIRQAKAPVTTVCGVQECMLILDFGST